MIKVTARGAGANMSVDFHVDDTVFNAIVLVAHPTFARVDRAVRRGDCKYILPGTATAGATQHNQLGAQPLPQGAELLASILVPPGCVAITNDLISTLYTPEMNERIAQLEDEIG